MDKHLKTTIIVAAIVAIIVSIISVYATQSVLLGPPTEPTAKPIIANSCNADGVCETNEINSQGIFNIRSYKPDGQAVPITLLDAKGFLLLNSSYSAGIAANEIVLTDPDRGQGQMPIFRISEGNDIWLVPDHEVVIGSAYGPADNGGLFVRNRVRLANLSGEGNGYVCVQQSGILIRSSTPCV